MDITYLTIVLINIELSKAVFQFFESRRIKKKKKNLYELRRERKLFN